jgi:parallel beta-helix repeat protein
MTHALRTLRSAVLAAIVLVLPAVAARAATISAACPPGSLGTFTVTGFAPGDVILVSGSCNVNLVIPSGTNDITIDGQGTATLTPADATQAAVTIRGRQITLRGFTITGGAQGVVVAGGSATITNNVIQSAVNGIVVLLSGVATITNNTIQNSTDAGIIVTEGGHARIGFANASDTAAGPNIVQGNGAGGITVIRGSSARIVGNTISTNTGDGVGVFRLSQADLSSNAIDGNTGHGVNVSQNSGVNLGRDTGTSIFDAPNTTGTPNTGFGVNCSLGGYLDGRIGTLNGTSGALVAPFPGSCNNSLQ